MTARPICLTLLVSALVLMLGAPVPFAHAAPVQPPSAPAPAASQGNSGAPASGAPAASGTPPPGNQGASVVTVTRWLPDPKEWAADVFTQTLVSMLQSVAQSLRGMLGGSPGGPADLLTQTPPGVSYANPAVVQLWGVTRAAANAALALCVLWGGYGVIVGAQTNTPYHEAMELLPRVAVGAILVNTSLGWGQLGIDISNALCQSLGATGLPDWNGLASSPTQAILDVLLILVYLVLGLLLLLQMLMRLALVDVLLVLAPLGLVCWILPQTEDWTRRWAFTFVGAVAVQFAQVLALHLGGGVITALPFGGGPSIFLAMAVLLLTLRLPGLFVHHAADGMAVVRGITRAQRTIGSAVARGASAASAAAGGAGAGASASGGATAGASRAATTAAGSGAVAQTRPNSPQGGTRW